MLNKLFSLIFIMIAALMGCNDCENTPFLIDDVFCPDCSIDYSDSFFSAEINADVLTYINIPNIVIKDDSEEGVFSFGYHFRKDDFEELYIKPLELKSTITDRDGELIHSFTTTEFDSLLPFIKIWDGTIEEEIYTGPFIYHIRMDFVDDQYIEVIDKAIATTCEDIIRCSEFDFRFMDLTNCLYHSYFYYRVNGHFYSSLCQ